MVRLVQLGRRWAFYSSRSVPLNYLASTTGVSPSHQPTDWPIQPLMSRSRAGNFMRLNAVVSERYRSVDVWNYPHRQALLNRYRQVTDGVRAIYTEVVPRQPSATNNVAFMPRTVQLEFRFAF